MRGNNGRRSVIFLLVMVIIGTPAQAATISGTIYQSDGTTLLTGHELTAAVISGNPCDLFTSWSWGPMASVNTTNGTYTITTIPAGTWYIRIINENSNYIEEWWAASGSTYDCHGAQALSVTTESTSSGIDFQLEPGSIISGTVSKESTGQPITGEGIVIMAISNSNPCGSEIITGRETDSSSGIYTMKGVPEGTWYLRTVTDRYYDEWWTSAGSLTNCQNAELVPVPNLGTITDKDFQLQFKTSNSYLLWTK